MEHFQILFKPDSDIALWFTSYICCQWSPGLVALQVESCRDAYSTSSSLVAPAVLGMPTGGATSNEKVGIKMIPDFQCNQFHYKPAAEFTYTYHIPLLPYVVHPKLHTVHIMMCLLGFSNGRSRRYPWCMMASSNGNIFRVTGLLCGKFTGHRWIPRTKASDAQLWCFLWSAPE